MDKKGSDEYKKAILKKHIYLMEVELKECYYEEIKDMVISDLNYARNELAKLENHGA